MQRETQKSPDGTFEVTVHSLAIAFCVHTDYNAMVYVILITTCPLLKLDEVKCIVNILLVLPSLRLQSFIVLQKCISILTMKIF